jgi:hypothetical protein
MDRIANTANNVTLTTTPSVPPETYDAVLHQLDPVNKPTLYSLATVNHQLHDLAMPFLMECHISTAESAFPAMSEEKRLATVLQVQKWLVDNADYLPLSRANNTWDRLHTLALAAVNHAELGLIQKITAQLSSQINIDQPLPGASISVEKLVAVQQQMRFFQSMIQGTSALFTRQASAFEIMRRLVN